MHTEPRYSETPRKTSLRKLFVSPYGATVFPIFVLVVGFLSPYTALAAHELNMILLNAQKELKEKTWERSAQQFEQLLFT